MATLLPGRPAWNSRAGDTPGLRVGVAAQTRDDPGMTRPVPLVTSLTLALAGAVLVLVPSTSGAQPAAAPVTAAAAAPATGDGSPNTFYSSPPDLLGRGAKPVARHCLLYTSPSPRDS